MGTLTFSQLGRYGRFGNQLFQIASTIGIAKKLRYNFAFPKWINYDAAERFGTKEPIDIYNYILNDLPEITNFAGYKQQFVHWGYHNVRLHENNWDISGHMQSEKYFDHCANLIRHYFTFKDEPDPINACAIHVRLGDYGGDYHPRQPMEYYRKAMDIIKADSYIIFSDSPDDAEVLFPDATISRSTNYIEDFKLMKACHSFIIANSTYSWWAAWLGNQEGKKVIAPALWFGPAAGLDTRDIYAKDWIII